MSYVISTLVGNESNYYIIIIPDSVDVFYKFHRGTEWPSGLRRRLLRTPTPVRTRPRVAFFFGQEVMVSGKKCRHPRRAWQLLTSAHKNHSSLPCSTTG